MLINFNIIKVQLTLVTGRGAIAAATPDEGMLPVLVDPSEVSDPSS